MVTAAERARVLALSGALLASCGGDGGVFTELVVPAGDPEVIIAGPDGNMWFTEAGGIGRVTMDGTVTEFPLPSGMPGRIATGPDGNIWFTVPGPGNLIGRFNVADATVDEYPTSIPDGDPYDLTSGPDGNLWFTEKRGSNFARMSLTGDVTIVPAPRVYPLGIVSNSDGNLWFSTLGGVGRLSTSSFDVETFGQSGGYTLAAGADGAVWFSELGSLAIGRASPSGDVVSFDLPDNMLALGMTLGRDGNIWFAAAITGSVRNAGDRIGRITRGGAVTYFSIPTALGVPIGIAAGPDGSLWFTESAGNKIGRFQPR